MTTFYESIKIIGAIKSSGKRERDAILEGLLAATSSEYLESIKEARANYSARRVKTHKEVFGQKNFCQVSLFCIKYSCFP
ncbi:MAG: hypothetical protein FJ117_10815 [Deltaproteobacteria bacterium]|nr:hypothetical protein [Deltaproteobacteria bacterium]